MTVSGTLGRNTSQNTTQLNGSTLYVSQLTDNFSASFSQLLPTGTSLLAGISMNRASSTALTNSFNPAYTGKVTYTVGQHLLQNYGRIANMRYIIEGKMTEKMAEDQFELQLDNIVSNAQKAYWNLVFADEDLKIKEASLELAKGTLSDNQMKVEIGTLAPLDLIQTETDIATRTDALVTSTYAVTTAEDAIKKLISGNKSASLFLLKLSPSDSLRQPATVVIPTLEQAVQIALENRPDLRSAQENLRIMETEERYKANQVLPILDVTATFNQNGVGGTQLAPLHHRRPGHGHHSREALFDSFSNLFGYNYNGYSVGFSLIVPLSNRANIADHNFAVVNKNLAEAQINATIQTILLDVRNSLTQAQLNRRRIDTAQTALDLAEKTLQAEKDKFDLGTSTLRFVLEDQDAVAIAQDTELQTRINFSNAMVDLDRALGTILSSNHIEIDKALTQGGATPYKPVAIGNQPGAKQK